MKVGPTAGKINPGVERQLELIEEMFKTWCGDETKRNHFMHDIQKLLGTEWDRLEKMPNESEKFVIFVANDYLELSHDKVHWQRNDWVKRARKILQG